MPHHYTVHKSRETLQEQWNYLLKRIQSRRLKILLYLFITFSISTVLYLLLYFFTSSDNFIVAKGVGMLLLALAWLSIIFYYIISLLGKIKIRMFRKFYLNSITDQQLNYQVEIDEVKVKIFSNNFHNEYLWDEYTTYIEHNNSIYVLNQARPLESLFWTQDELGIEGYAFLLDILVSRNISRTE